MKYQNLRQIGDYLQKFHKITQISRSNDNCIRVEFDGREVLFFDLNKTHSNIHKNPDFRAIKEYKAPFDTLLSKRFKSAKIKSIIVLENNRVMEIYVVLSGSYKEFASKIYFEFTGRFTNIILTDENGVILEALRHYSNEFRTIQTGKIYAPLAPTEIKEKEVPKIGNFDEFFLAEFRQINEQNLSNLKSAKIQNIDKKIANFTQILSSLGEEDELLKNAKNLSQKAEILTANLYNLRDFDRRFSLVDFSGQNIDFELENPPKIAANEYYTKAKKLKQKAANLKIERKNLNEKIAFLNSLKNLIQSSQSVDEIAVLHPKKSSKKIIEKFSDDTQSFYIDSYKISVGKNEKGNEFLLNSAKKNDFWFHIKDTPSAHVIVKSNKQNLREDIVEFAAKICVAMSVKNSGKFEVDYTKRENIKIINKAFVNYTNYRTIWVNFIKSNEI